MTVDEFFALALSLPEMVEGLHDGRRDLRLRGQIIATAALDGSIVSLRLQRRFQENTIVLYDAAFPAPNPRGRAGWTQLALPNATEEEARDILEMAWMSAMPPKLHHLLDEEDA